MAGAGQSKNMVVEVTAGSQSNTASFKFTYTAPNITSIDLLAQKVPIGADGVRMIVYGTDFADVTPIANRIAIRGIQGDATVPCLNVERVSYEELRCDYPQGGDGETNIKVEVEVAGQKSNSDAKLVYCSDVHIVTKVGLENTATIALERGKTVSFTAELSTPLAATSGAVAVRAAIVAGGGAHCALITPTGDVQRSHGNYKTPFFVNVTTKEADHMFTAPCVVELTLESDDQCYNETAKTFVQELEITVTPKICS
jgi:hypothetical protein